MAINETKSTGNKYRRLTDAANMIWQRLSFWTDASDVEFDNNNGTLAANLTANGNVFKFGYDGSQYGYYIDGTFYPFGGDHTTTIDIRRADWTQLSTPKAGIANYSYTKTFNHIYSDSPIIGLTTTSANNVVPTAAERADYALLCGAVTSDNQITFYAMAQPAEQIRLVVKGAD